MKRAQFSIVAVWIGYNLIKSWPLPLIAIARKLVENAVAFFLRLSLTLALVRLPVN
jgi:hypothetical protein